MDPKGHQHAYWFPSAKPCLFLANPLNIAALPSQAERAMSAHRRLSVAVLTARRASVLFAAHDPLRPLMDAVLDLANSVGECCGKQCG